MFLAATLAVAQVALAAAVTLLPVRSLFSAPLRTFSWTAALAVTLLSLMPEAFEELGWVALLLISAAVIIPILAERLSDRRWGHAGRLGLEVAFVGVLIHRVVDGVGLGAFGRIESLRADVLIALSAHAIAVESVVILKCRALLGARSAWFRSLWLAVAGILGVVVWSRVYTQFPDPTPVVEALTAGVLLHVALHDVRHPPEGREVSRWVHFVAAILGVLITQIPGGAEPGITLTASTLLLATLIAISPIALITWRKRFPHDTSHS
ncbi:MAG: hypothetical protein SFV15_08250 [Polyangiaceae bacterium]|nr:hypothetical protein [Polyangiaceae bacterium]